MIIIKEIQEQEREKIGWLIIRWTMTQVIVLILHSLWIVIQTIVYEEAVKEKKWKEAMDS